MNWLTLFLISLLLAMPTDKTPNSVHEFTIQDIDGQEIDLSKVNKMVSFNIRDNDFEGGFPE